MNIEELKSYITKEKIIDRSETFNEMFNYFFDDNFKEDRLNLYKSYVESYGLNKLSDAKIQIVKILFSDYIEKSLNEYQKTVENFSNKDDDTTKKGLEVIDKEIKNIAKLSGIFKSYDEDNFNSYILSSVEGINLDEVIAIFDKVQMSPADIKLINDTIKKVLNDNKVHHSENFAKDFINHELTDLFILPRKKAHIYNPDNFDKFTSLANAISKHKIAENIEGFDGGMAYLISLDLVFGLNSLKNSDNPSYKKVGELLLKVEENKFDNFSLKELMVEAVKQSRNIKEKPKGGYIEINNSGSTLRLPGPADRIFNFNDLVRVFLHTVSGNCDNENNQVGRSQQIYNIDNLDQYSIQIGTRPPIDRKINGFSDDVTISRREQVLLSHMRNFSYITPLVAFGKKDVSVLNKTPLELWASSLQASKNYMNDYLASEDKINDVGNSWFYLLDKYKVLEQDISTNTQDPKHEHIINPMLRFADSVNTLYNKEPEKYQQLISNIYHVLDGCENVFLNGNPDVMFRYLNLMSNLNSLNEKGQILDKNFFSIGLVNDPYVYRDNPIQELVLSSKNIEKDLVNFFDKNQHSLTINRLSDLDLETLRSLDEDVLLKIMPNIKTLAISDIQSIYETEAAQARIDLVKNIVDELCHENKEKREFCGGTNLTYCTPSQVKFTTMCNKIEQGRNRDIVEILGKTAFITNAKLHSQYEYKINKKKDVNEQFGLVKRKM